MCASELKPDPLEEQWALLTKSSLQICSYIIYIIHIKYISMKNQNKSKTQNKTKNIQLHIPSKLHSAFCFVFVLLFSEVLSLSQKYHITSTICYFRCTGTFRSNTWLHLNQLCIKLKLCLPKQGA